METRFLRLVLVVALLAGVQAPAEPLKPKVPTLAVLYFDYTGKDEELGALRKGLAQMLISDLAGSDGVRLVERERLQEVLAELKLGRTASFDANTAAKVGKLLGAQLMVMGSYFALGSTLRADARVVEVETGRVLHSTGATGKADDFLLLEQKLGAALLSFVATVPKASESPVPEKRDGPAPSGETGRRARVSPPTKLHLRTALRYSKALDALDAGKKAEAKSELEAVVKEQPDFRLASLDLDKLMK